jgi:Zn-dependent oligopeptidase
VFGNLSSSLSSPRLREIERELAPLEAAHSDALRLDPALFARVDAVHEARHDSGLVPEASGWSSAITSTACWPAPARRAGPRAGCRR